MNKKILFFAINSRYTHSCFALFYLRTTIADCGYDYKIVENSINDQYLDICNNIFVEKPDILVLPIYIWNRDIIEYLLSDIKKVLPNLIVVVGGPEASYNAEYYLNNYNIDFLIKGAGEKAFYELAQEGFKSPQRLISKPNYSFNEVAFPYQNQDKEQLKHKYVYYESSRGCPFKCSYCLSSREEQRLEYKDIDTVKDELQRLIAFDPTIIKFIDRSFNVNQSFAKAVWAYLIDLNPACTFHFEIHPSFIDQEMLELLTKARKQLFQFEIGVQSTNPLTLQAINRDTNWDPDRLALQNILKLDNIHFHLDQIAGLPYEDYQSLQNSFNSIIGLKPDHYQTGILKVLFGTEMYDKQKEYDLVYSSKPPYQVYSTKWLKYEELTEYIGVDQIVDTLYNSGHFTYFLTVLFKQSTDIYQSFLLINMFFQKHKVKKNEKNYQKLFNILAEVVQAMGLKEIERFYYLDGLRLDWAIISQAHFFPEKLNSDICESFRQETWAIIKENREHDYYLHEGNKLSLSELRRSRFFKAVDESFYDYIGINSSPIEGLIIIDDNKTIKWVKKV